MSKRAGKQRQRKDGKFVWAIGARAGYWPCLGAAFLKVDFGPYFIELCSADQAPAWWKEGKR